MRDVRLSGGGEAKSDWKRVVEAIVVVAVAEFAIEAEAARLTSANKQMQPDWRKIMNSSVDSKSPGIEEMKIEKEGFAPVLLLMRSVRRESGRAKRGRVELVGLVLELCEGWTPGLRAGAAGVGSFFYLPTRVNFFWRTDGGVLMADRKGTVRKGK